MMSRKDYQAFAVAIGSERRRYDQSEEGRGAIDRLTGRLCDLFGNDNPAFDRGRFIRAIDAASVEEG